MTSIAKLSVEEHWLISIEYDDGLKGEINLTHLKNKPEYKSLKDFKYFSSVQVDNKSGDLIWNNGISLCKNAMYKQLELKRLAKSLKLDLDKIEE